LGLAKPADGLGNDQYRLRAKRQIDLILPWTRDTNFGCRAVDSSQNAVLNPDKCVSMADSEGLRFDPLNGAIMQESDCGLQVEVVHRRIGTRSVLPGLVPSMSQDSKRRPSKRSLYGLDSLNFLMADVRDGIGPFLSVYLKGGQHWGAGEIGIAMAASSIVGAICQIPAGLMVDGIRSKRLLVAMSGLIVALGCLSLWLFPNFYLVIASQVLLGAASAIIPPTLAAISLGLVGRAGFPARISRNEGFNHGGNFTAAILAGVIGQRFGYQWIFFLVCFYAVASAAVTGLIRPNEIDHAIARGGESEVEPEGSLAPVGGQANSPPMPVADLFKQKDLLIFLASVILFHFGNAAMLPMAGQVLAKTHPGADVSALGACIIAAQLVMIGVATAVGSALRRGIRRRTIFMIALVLLPIRGCLFAVTDGPMAIVGIQLLDGVAAGIFGVVSVVIAADLMRGTGRFNLAQGLVALATGLGASISNLVAGFVVQAFGYSTGFMTLAGVALLALLFFAMLMPETGPRSKVAAYLPNAGLPADMQTSD
jgi:predicted MFS family arabinose efflux permease